MPLVYIHIGDLIYFTHLMSIVHIYIVFTYVLIFTRSWRLSLKKLNLVQQCLQLEKEEKTLNVNVDYIRVFIIDLVLPGGPLYSY